MFSTITESLICSKSAVELLIVNSPSIKYPQLHGYTVWYSVVERRQTMLFSATQTRKIEDLARISLKKEPLYVGVDDQKDKATVEGLEQVAMTTMTSSTISILLHAVTLRIKVSTIESQWVFIDVLKFHVLLYSVTIQAVCNCCFRAMLFVLQRNDSCCCSPS